MASQIVVGSKFLGLKKKIFGKIVGVQKLILLELEGIKDYDVVVVKFGGKFKQWNERIS